MHACWLLLVAISSKGVGRTVSQVSDAAASFSTCPAKDGISCDPSNSDRPNPYHTCIQPKGSGAPEQPYIPLQTISSYIDTPMDSYVPIWYKPALTADQQAFLRNKTCVPGGTTVCPYYGNPVPKGADGFLSADDYVIELAHVNEAYDDFTGITYRGLNLAWDTWNKTLLAAANSVGAPPAEGLVVFGREAFHAWWLWFPEGPQCITRFAPLPARTTYTNTVLILNAVGVFGNLQAQILALVHNDSTLFMTIANNLAEFHHALQKNRPSVMKHHHFRTFERSILQTVQFFLGNQLDPERAQAVEELIDFIFRFNSHFMNLYDIGCKSFVNYEDFRRDPPNVPPPPSWPGGSSTGNGGSGANGYAGRTR